MELNNQYYKYIYNTLPKNRQQQGDSDLKIGSVIKNLVPDLVEENLYNPNYKGFYGDITNYANTKWYPAENQIETIENGLLRTKVSLKGNKSYVLQILNAVAPQSLTEPIYNSIQYGDNKELYLDQYIYFKPLEDIECTINCYGVGYSYVLYGTKRGKLCELRSFSVSEKSKVFLFESNMPWRVDDTGTIVDISETKLLYLGNSSTNGIEVKLTTDDILNIFSEAPKMQIDKENNTLFTYMPQSKSDGTWKYKPIWETIYSLNKLEVMDNIYLIAYRNFLDVVERDYDNKQYPRQYGQIRTAQINKQSTRDTIRTQSGKINKIRYIALKLTDIQNNKKQINTSSTITIEKSTTEPYLQLFSLLGYNYYYTNNKQFDDDLKYKYTSISFAWCVRINDKWSRISEFSEPIFIERNLCTSVGKDDKNQPIFGFEEYNIIRKTSDYYPNESIYIEKKQPLV